MTPTEAAIENLRNEAQRPNSILAAEIALLLAQRDRFEKALRKIAKGRENDGCAYCGEQDEDDHTADCPTMIAQEELRCESSSL